MIYQFKNGVRLSKKCDPQKIGEQLEQIRAKHEGKLRVNDVLTDAASPSSPLHPVFTWNNEIAAHKFREDEARRLIRHVVIVKQDGEQTRAFWNVRIAVDSEAAEQYYQSVSVVSDSPKEYAAALKLVLADLIGAESSLKELKNIAPRSQRRPVNRAVGHIAEARQVLTT